MFYEDNPEILNKFLMYKLNNENLSSKTVQEYSYDLYNFLKAMKVIKKSYKELENLSKEDFDKISIKDLDSDFLNKISSLDIDYYISYLNINKKYKPQTRARQVASIKSFFKCLYLNFKEINNNPAEVVKAPKLGVRIPKYLTLSEAQSLLNTIKNDNESKYKERDYCIITLFLNCGMRLSELISIDITSIRDNDTINVLGKGNKERTVYLNNACKKALDDYKVIRNTQNNIKDKNALFLSERGTRLSRRTVEYIVEKYITKADLDPNKFTPHKLRHTAATLMYGNGVDIRTLQEVLGHESIKTTEIYTHIDNGEIREAINNNPLNTEI